MSTNMTLNNSVNANHSACFNAPQLLNEEMTDKVLKWICILEALGIIVLNTLLIILLRRRRKQSRMAFFVQHLAISDLCVGVLYVLPKCIFEHFLKSWEKYSCFILHGFCTNMSICASTFLIVVLTIDRLYVIEKPLSASKTGKKYRYGLIAGAWLFAVPLAIIYAAHIRFECTNQGLNVCWHFFRTDFLTKAMVISEAVMNVFIPVCIIAFCYAWIVLIIRRRERAGFATSEQSVKFSNGQTMLVGSVQRGSSLITNAKKKTIKVLLVVVLVYIISWSPITFAQLFNVYNILPVGVTYQFLHALAPINSLMNPVVFMIFNRQMLKSDRNRMAHNQTTTSPNTAYEPM